MKTKNQLFNFNSAKWQNNKPICVCNSEKVFDVDPEPQFCEYAANNALKVTYTVYYKRRDRVNFPTLEITFPNNFNEICKTNYER